MSIEAKRRGQFQHFHTIQTRWMDNDAYGHVNNVVYYSWFDTVVNQFLIVNQALDIEKSREIGLVIETQCNYLASVAFPDVICAGVTVSKLGNSSVRYEIGIFKNDEDAAAAQGHFVHVYVDRETRRPVQIPEKIRKLLSTLEVSVR
ncbi:acyl-CoA thioesterase [Undibacterium sp. Jales W-56]|uniref:acyl-CoA thioesterase n=1 Tax=Undibacterium sp. Jales W-56 TaxID=2897325 RepID=UPI0021D2C432|nr:thioesterase family protein [Undibacterium sp. Jales W-56]MCU6435526.1 acyl-CoA thioesterase [Undibacterium sp. Jales W-56]